MLFGESSALAPTSVPDEVYGESSANVKSLLAAGNPDDWPAVEAFFAWIFSFALLQRGI
jgi:hypothetical protein